MTTFLLDLERSCDLRSVLSLLQIPEDEVDLVLVNGNSAESRHAVGDGDRISIYPVFESFDIGSLELLRERPLRVTKFILDVHLGKLASHLRMLGFDTLYRTDYHDDQLVSISNGEKRILLSRDRQLLASRGLNRAYYVPETDPRLQLIKVLQRFDLFTSAKPFQRCLRCNTLLQKVDKTEVQNRLPQRSREHFNEFETCPACERIYWKGSHYSRMEKFIHEVLRTGNLQGDNMM